MLGAVSPQVWSRADPRWVQASSGQPGSRPGLQLTGFVLWHKGSRAAP